MAVGQVQGFDGEYGVNLGRPLRGGCLVGERKAPWVGHEGQEQAVQESGEPWSVWPGLPRAVRVSGAL